MGNVAVPGGRRIRVVRLFGSVIRRLGAPSALRPSGRRPGSGVALERAIAPPSQAGVGFGLRLGSHDLFWPEPTP